MSGNSTCCWYSVTQYYVPHGRVIGVETFLPPSLHQVFFLVRNGQTLSRLKKDLRKGRMSPSCMVCVWGGLSQWPWSRQTGLHIFVFRLSIAGQEGSLDWKQWNLRRVRDQGEPSGWKSLWMHSARRWANDHRSAFNPNVEWSARWSYNRSWPW